MSSDQYKVVVRAIDGTQVDLAYTLSGDMERVYDEPLFIVRTLTDALDDDTLDALIPARDHDAREAWIEQHADRLIVPGSIVLHDEENHPRDAPSISQLTERLRREFTARWATEPLAVVALVGERLKAYRRKLEFQDEPSLYLAGSLEELVSDLADAMFMRQARLTSRASLRFRLTDARWCAGLRVGERFGSVASP